MSDKQVVMSLQDDGSYLMHELTADEAAERQRQREDAERFEAEHGLPYEQYLSLWHRQSQLCGQCSEPLDIEQSCFEEGDHGPAIYCPNCSMTLWVRRDRERFGGGTRS